MATAGARGVVVLAGGVSTCRGRGVTAGWSAREAGFAGAAAPVSTDPRCEAGCINSALTRTATMAQVITTNATASAGRHRRSRSNEARSAWRGASLNPPRARSSRRSSLRTLRTAHFSRVRPMTGRASRWPRSCQRGLKRTLRPQQCERAARLAAVHPTGLGRDPSKW
jgi:hypothetical protein